ncbi:T9SS type A sorting domain-containing protein [Chitinophagales bacterium]|nr:T9SS type A sorting domain-containing protein [Chitinophagales bacterium]
MKKLIGLLLFVGLSVSAQSNWGTVHNILSTKCQSCHSGAQPAGGMDLAGSAAEVYDRLLEEVPENSFAASRGYRLIDAGYPDRSFIYRKANGDLYPESELEDGEGATMPTQGEALTDAEREILRSWIMHGAPETGAPVNVEAINDWYLEGGLSRIDRPEPPAEGEGFQLYLGTIFLGPGEEVEYIYKYELRNEQPIEITGLDVNMNEDSHHFLLFSFDEGADANEEEGLEEVTLFGGGNAITTDTKMVGGWAYSQDVRLPAKVAYNWRADNVLKFNYHIKNYSTTATMPAEVYINVYTQPVGTATHEMLTEFQLSNEFLIIPANSERTFTWDLNDFEQASSNDSIHLWLFGAHTHQYGTDFNAWQRTPEGNKGEIIYEGTYDIDYTFDTGFYDYSHPPMRIFESFYSFREQDGLFVEGDYHNTSNQTVTLGLQTVDEMFGAFMQYIVGDISDLLEDSDTIGSGIENSQLATLQLRPNPTTDLFEITIPEGDLTQLSIYDESGRLVYEAELEVQSLSYQKQLGAKELGLVPGVYAVLLKGEKSSSATKLMVK